MIKTHPHIAQSISRKKEGELIFPRDFRGFGTEAAIKKALSRLEKAGKIKRLAHGIYFIPKIDPVLGELRPGADEVVKSIARHERIKVRPAGAYALHRLGLTDQVPARLVYVTDGGAKQFKLGKLLIRFKPTTPKKMATTGEISSLVIQALEELGTIHIDPLTEKKIKDLLKKEDVKKLNHDLKLASAKVNDYIIKLLKPRKNDELAKTNG